VSADVMTCKQDDAKQWHMQWIGGHPITGHASTPLFSASPAQVQRALDLATSDLENQLYCIIGQAAPEALGGDASVRKGGAFQPQPLLVAPTPSPTAMPSAVATFTTWCNTYYAALVTIDVGIPNEAGQPGTHVNPSTETEPTR
jgi:hypothetical protein